MSFFFSLFILAGAALAEEPGDPEPVEALGAPQVLFENPVPVSVHATGDKDYRSLLLGRYFGREAQAEYRAKVDGGAAPAAVPGPEGVYQLSLAGAAAKTPRLAFNLEGEILADPASVPAPGDGSAPGKSFVYVTMVDNAVFERCRKAAQAPEACPAYAAGREIGLASYDAEGGWAFEGTVIKAPEFGGAAVASVLLRGQELWLYFFGGRKEPGGPGLYRLRLGPDGKSRLGAAEPVVFEAAPGARTFDHADVVALKCDRGGAFTASMAASTSQGSAIPFLISRDGLRFRQVAESLLRYQWHEWAAPSQLPVEATAGDCDPSGKKHETARELVYSERTAAGAWAVKTAKVIIHLPELK